MRVALSTVLVAMLVVSMGSGASAEPSPSDPEVRQGTALFEEAQALLRTPGKLDEACAKFKESLAHLRAVGTILNIAKCEARQNKIASAVATFREARAIAQGADQPEVVEVADTNIAELTPFIPHLTILLAETAPGTTISIDGEAVALADIASLPVDPGSHEVIVRAPQRAPHTERVKLDKRDHKTLSIAALASLGGAFPTTAVVVSASGGAVFVAGVGIGFVALSHWNTAKTNQCGGNVETCSKAGKTAIDSARTLGDVGTIVGAVGLVTAGFGTYLWLAHRHDHARAGEHDHEVSVLPMADGERVGVWASGRF